MFGVSGDAKELGGDGKKFQLIVTDPPYGFNTDENNEEMALKYRKWLGALICSLANDGHLVISLPEHSYTGKKVSFSANPSLVTSQILSIAAGFGRTVYRVAKSIPEPRSFFAPPYYWRSERALVRSILHFRIS